MSNLAPLPPVFSGAELGEPLLFKAAAWLVWGDVPDNLSLNMHPMAFAAWFGLLATALNLFPIGQFDGGHIAYAAFGPAVVLRHDRHHCRRARPVFLLVVVDRVDGARRGAALGSSAGGIRRPGTTTCRSIARACGWRWWRSSSSSSASRRRRSSRSISSGRSSRPSEDVQRVDVDDRLAPEVRAVLQRGDDGRAHRGASGRAGPSRRTAPGARRAAAPAARGPARAR